MKGQMFIVIIIFLAGLVFIIHQILFQYSLFDVSSSFVSNDIIFLKSVSGAFENTMKTAKNCLETQKSLLELKSAVESLSPFEGLAPEIEYSFDCQNWFSYRPDRPPLNVSVSVRTGSQSSEEYREYYRKEPDCEEITQDWTIDNPSANTPDVFFEYSPEGQCRFFDRSDSDYTKISKNTGQDFADNYTFTLNAKFDQLVPFVEFYPTSASSDKKTWTLHGFFIYNGLSICEVHFGADGIYLRRGSMPSVRIQGTAKYTDNNWHEWTLLYKIYDPADVSKSTATLYRDGVLIPEINDIPCYDSSTKDGRLGFDNLGNSTYTAEMHIASFRIEDGLIPPSTP